MSGILDKIDDCKTFLRKRFFLILIISLLSSYLCIYQVPSYVNETFTPEMIESQVSGYFGGMVAVSSSEVIKALVWMLQSSVLTTSLLLIAYLFKYDIDRRLFNIKKWRDWKFLIFIAAVPVIIADLLQKFDLFTGIGFSSNFLVNILLTLISSFLLVFLSSLIMGREKEKIVIDSRKIEEELMENKR
ncbi:MAG: hypothetical protein BWY21_01134 [Parcubacteria group bacterium ADurb.Bin216]|nr:MAG: hypothetical protein BWY21_01134 [Parcubacteria group bacterium ADurb.Bin216]